MFREIILPISRSIDCVLQLVVKCTHDVACRRPATSWVHYTTNCNTLSSAPEDGQSNCPKHLLLTGIINKPLLLHLVGCLYYLYQCCTVKQISYNEIYLLIKYIKSVMRRVAKSPSYIEDAQCLKVKMNGAIPSLSLNASIIWCSNKCRDKIFTFIVYLTKLFQGQCSAKYGVDSE